MKTTLNLRKDVLDQAMRAAGVREKTAVIHLGLQELIAKAARERLSKLGGQMKTARAPRRRRTVRA